MKSIYDYSSYQAYVYDTSLSMAEYKNRMNDEGASTRWRERKAAIKNKPDLRPISMLARAAEKKSDED